MSKVGFLLFSNDYLECFSVSVPCPQSSLALVLVPFFSAGSWVSGLLHDLLRWNNLRSINLRAEEYCWTEFATVSVSLFSLNTWFETSGFHQCSWFPIYFIESVLHSDRGLVSTVFKILVSRCKMDRIYALSVFSSVLSFWPSDFRG